MRQVPWLAALLAFAVACADEAPPGGAADAPASGRTGVLRYGYDLTNTGGISLDPIDSNTYGDFVHMSLIYDSLLRPDGSGGYLPGLAVSWEIVDPRTVELRLREGVRFHDGTAFDAESVRATIQRNLAAHNRNHAPQLREVEAVEITGPLELRIRLASAIAGAFLEVLAGRETMPVSPAAVATGAGPEDVASAVGAGPYRVAEYVPERLLRLRRVDEHWDAHGRRLAGIDFVHVPPGPPRVNALLSGDIDLTDYSASEHRALAKRPNVTTSVRTSPSAFLYFTMCKRMPPFDDPRVRRAISMAIDRDAIASTVLKGLGEVAWMAWPSESRYYDPGLVAPQAYDPDTARALLAEAGYPNGFAFDTMTQASAPALLRLAEVLQAQLGAVGLDVKIRTTSHIINDFIDETTPTLIVAWVRPGLQKITRMFGPDSVANYCGYSDPELDALTARIAALPPDHPQVTSLWHELLGIVARDGLVTYLAFQPIVVAWNPDVVGGVGQIYDVGQGIDLAPVFVK